MFARFHRVAVLAAVSLSLLMVLAGCQKNTPVAPELPNLAIGVVGAVQPAGTSDLLAGFIPEDRHLASAQAISVFNSSLMQVLGKQTKRTYTFIPQAGGPDPTQARSAGRNGALAHWVAIGRKMKVDLLIVPQILDWQERAGSSAGVTTSAGVNMDFFLIDTRTGDGALVS